MKIISDPFKENRFVTCLLEWSTYGLRDFPWRRNRTLYNVFISEIFLQRTKADQVKPVYESFIGSYPTFEHLDSVTEEDLMPYFQQLGLIKRVYFLIEILKLLKNSDDELKDLPPNRFKLLPGIGNYTGNAIACFGLGQRLPLVDSNILRIFKRYFEMESDNKIPRNDAEIWTFASEIMPVKNYDVYNYALIDFGALICTPNHPQCRECPLNSECSFYKKVQIL